MIVESFMIFSTGLGFYLFHRIHQDVKKHSEHLDVVLLIICLVGPLVYGMFSMFGIALNNLEAHDSVWVLSFVLPFLDILQCLSQVCNITLSEIIRNIENEQQAIFLQTYKVFTKSFAI